MPRQFGYPGWVRLGVTVGERDQLGLDQAQARVACAARTQVVGQPQKAGPVTVRNGADGDLVGRGVVDHEHGVSHAERGQAAIEFGGPTMDRDDDRDVRFAHGRGRDRMGDPCVDEPPGEESHRAIGDAGVPEPVPHLPTRLGEPEHSRWRAPQPMARRDRSGLGVEHDPEPQRERERRRE